MRPHPLRSLALLVLIPALLLRCGAAAPGLSRTLSDRTTALLARAPQVYAPSASTETAGGETEALRATFEAALEPQARARLRHEPALDLVAAATAENFSDQGERASRPLLQWMFWRSGSAALYLEHSGGFTGKRYVSDLEEWARRAAEHINASPGRSLSYGLARFTAGRIHAETMVFGASYFDAPAFSKTYAPGGPLTLALRPRSPLREIRFLLDRGDAIEAETLSPRPDGSFFVSHAAPARPGRYFIEIQGPGPVRSTLLMVPIYVGVPEPTAPDAFIQRPPQGPADLAGWPGWLASTYGAERAKVGRPPVTLDTRLGTLAAERSALLAADRHGAPLDTPAFAARLAAEGLAARDFAETAVTLHDTDDVLLHLLWPSTRERLVLSGRVLLGAAVTPRPTKEKEAPSFTLVEETVTQGAAP